MQGIVHWAWDLREMAHWAWGLRDMVYWAWDLWEMGHWAWGHGGSRPGHGIAGNHALGLESPGRWHTGREVSGTWRTGRRVFGIWRTGHGIAGKDRVLGLESRGRWGFGRGVTGDHALSLGSWGDRTGCGVVGGTMPWAWGPWGFLILLSLHLCAGLRGIPTSFKQQTLPMFLELRTC